MLTWQRLAALPGDTRKVTVSPISRLRLAAGATEPHANGPGQPRSSQCRLATGRAKIRMVDVSSTRYAIARRYMIRLRRDDFEEPLKLARIAETAGMAVTDFRKEFEYLIASELPPLVFRAGV